jgi:pimeloyl-ACP methyl ester carboxylesterase
LPAKAADMLTGDAIAELSSQQGTVYGHLKANNAWVGWNASLRVPVYFIHCPLDDVVPYQNALVAQAALRSLNTAAEVVPVPPVPFVDQVAGSVHAAAYPTAMLVAFKIIEGELP